MKARVKILFKNGVSKDYILELDENETIDAYLATIEHCMINNITSTLELIDPENNMLTIISVYEIVTFGYYIEEELENN